MSFYIYIYQWSSFFFSLIRKSLWNLPIWLLCLCDLNSEKCSLLCERYIGKYTIIQIFYVYLLYFCYKLFLWFYLSTSIWSFFLTMYRIIWWTQFWCNPIFQIFAVHKSFSIGVSIFCYQLTPVLKRKLYLSFIHRHLLV